MSVVGVVASRASTARRLLHTAREMPQVTCRFATFYPQATPRWTAEFLDSSHYCIPTWRFNRSYIALLHSLIVSKVHAPWFLVGGVAVVWSFEEKPYTNEKQIEEVRKNIEACLIRGWSVETKRNCAAFGPCVRVVVPVSLCLCTCPRSSHQTVTKSSGFLGSVWRQGCDRERCVWLYERARGGEDIDISASPISTFTSWHAAGLSICVGSWKSILSLLWLPVTAAVVQSPRPWQLCSVGDVVWSLIWSLSMFWCRGCSVLERLDCLSVHKPKLGYFESTVRILPVDFCIHQAKRRTASLPLCIPCTLHAPWCIFRCQACSMVDALARQWRWRTSSRT